MKTRQVAKTARSEATTALPSYRADIDGLRAIAVLLVLVFHFDLIPGNRAGFIGVDVFFVISGYLITSILIRQLDAGSFSFRAFYIARIRRLAPALTATLLLVMAAGVAQLFPDDLRELARQALAAQFYIANLYYWRNVNYFGLGTGNVFLLHMWSLAVEEQFYLLYPLAIVIVHRYAPRRLGLAIALGLVVSLALNVGFVAAKPEATFYLLPTRAWELLTGAMLLFGLRRRRAAAADEGLGVLGVALLVAAVVAYRDDIPFPGFFAMLPVAGAACLLLSGESRPTAVSRLLALAPVTYIGKISYPLYLVHWPVNVLAQRAVGQNYGFAWRLASFMFSFGLAAVLYHAVENPFRHRRILADGRSLLRGYGAGLAATVLAFGVVVATAGLPRRFPAEALRLAGYVNDRSPVLTECEFDGRRLQADADFCAIGKPGVRPSWLVYGDSHAWAAHAAFDYWLASKGEAGLFMYRNSCPPIEGIHILGDNGRCNAFNSAVAAFLETQADIGSVVLVSTWKQAPEGRLSRERDKMLPKGDALALFDEKFAATLARLHRLGKRAYVWAPVPGASQNVPLALARATLAKRPADIEFTREQYFADNAFFFSAVEKNRARIAVLLSPAEVLCASGRCAATIDGNPAYFDNAHIANSGAVYWAGMMQRAEQAASAASR